MSIENQGIGGAGAPPASEPVRSPLWRWLERLASLKLTLVIIAALLAGVVTAYVSEARATWSLALPLTASALNLAAAIVVNPVFRRQAGLLVFHVALVSIVLLIAIGRLTFLKGHTELSVGETFDGRLASFEAGPLHHWGLERLSFANLGFTIDYDAGLRRGHTVNRVAWIDGEGKERTAEIGDNVPLVLGGYRFYTSFNKGFAPAFEWQPARGEPRRGTIHLPAYPIHELNQALEWTPPGSSLRLWTMLKLDQPVLDESKPTRFRVPERHEMVIRQGEQRWVLHPGESVRFEDGVLHYVGLSTWMGYTVFYDWTTSWLLAACGIAVVSLSWHFWRKFAARPW